MEPEAEAAISADPRGSRATGSTGRRRWISGGIDDELRTLLKGSPMKRAGVRRLRRNLAVAIGNTGGPGAAHALESHDAPTCHDPLVEEHIAWALGSWADGPRLSRSHDRAVRDAAASRT